MGTYLSQETRARLDKMQSGPSPAPPSRDSARTTIIEASKKAEAARAARKAPERLGRDVWSRDYPKPTDRKQTGVQGVKNLYGRTQQAISQKIPTLKEIQAAGGRFRQKRPELAGRIYQKAESLAGTTRKVLPERTGRAIGESSVEFYQYAQQKPLDLAKEVGMAYGGGYVLGGAAKVGSVGLRYGAKQAAARAGTGIAGKGITTGAKYIEPSIGVVGAGAMGYSVVSAPTQKEAIERMAHLGVGTAGAVKGFKAGGKLVERIQVRGLKEVPIEQIMKPEVIAGKEQFPTVPEGMSGKQFKQYFKESPYKLPKEVPGLTRVWHATPQKFTPQTEIQAAVTRGSDVPGLYVAPSISPHFLRVGGVKAPTTPTKIPLFKRLFGESEPLEPAVLRIDVPGGITRLPKSIRTKVEPSREFLETQATPGKGYLTPVLEKALAGKGVGVEAEAVLAPKTLLAQTGSKYYIKIGEHRVPIKEYTAELGIAPKVGKVIRTKKTAAKVSKEIEYYRPPSIREPIVRPYGRGYTARRETYTTPARREAYTTPARKGEYGIDYAPAVRKPDYTLPPITKVKIDPGVIVSKTKRKLKKKERRYDIYNPVPDLKDLFGSVK